MRTSLGRKNNVGFDLGGRCFVFLDKLEDDGGMGIRVPLLRLGCNCFELDVIRNEKIMSALIWVAGVLFFWTSWKMTAVWGFESLYYAWVVIVLSLMSYGMKNCGCC